MGILLEGHRILYHLKFHLFSHRLHINYFILYTSKNSLSYISSLKISTMLTLGRIINDND